MAQCVIRTMEDCKNMCALYCKVSAVRLTSSTADSRLLTVESSISCRRWTRATRCLRPMRMMLYTKVDAHCDKLALVVGQTSTDASRGVYAI